ncbi:hypothetical protein GCM10017687_29650 [Streptomyces echinatus]
MGRASPTGRSVSARSMDSDQAAARGRVCSSGRTSGAASMSFLVRSASSFPVGSYGLTGVDDVGGGLGEGERQVAQVFGEGGE